MDDNREQVSRDLDQLRGLIRRVLHSGGADLEANEELEFFQDHGDPFVVTATTSPSADRALLQEAFRLELDAFIAELLADGRVTPEEAAKRRSAMFAVEGSTLNLERIVAESKRLMGDSEDWAS